MGERGPARTPTAVLRLRGSDRAAARTRDEPAPPAVIPERPAWLRESAVVHWERTIELLGAVPGLLTIVDGNTIALYAEALADYIEAQAEVAESGITTTGAMGTPIMNPAVRVREAAWARVVKHGAQLGMSPADRARIVVDKPQAKPNAKGYFSAG